MALVLCIFMSSVLLWDWLIQVKQTHDPSYCCSRATWIKCMDVNHLDGLLGIYVKSYKKVLLEMILTYDDHWLMILHRLESNNFRKNSRIKNT